MEEALPFEALPSEIILNVLSRIPAKSVFACKCVCKSWLGLLKTREFALSHRSKSLPGLIIHHVVKRTDSRWSNPQCGLLRHSFEIYEPEDSSFETARRVLFYKAVLEPKCEKVVDGSSLDANSRGVSPARIASSTDGLLFLRSSHPHPNAYYICNPIAREYVMLPRPVETGRYPDMVVPCGFGVSRLTNRYRVVRIFDDIVECPDKKWLVRQSFAQVYTLGTESWGSSTTPCDMMLNFSYSSVGTFLNGNIHWLARYLVGSWGISCFDLETEVFTYFPAPTVGPDAHILSIGVLRERLCLCDNSHESEVTIYLMGDCGDGTKSWNREYVIRNIPVSVYIISDDVIPVYVVKAFENGDLLLGRDGRSLCCYAHSTKTIARVDRSDMDGMGRFEAVSYTPSFISLKGFGTENVKLF